MVRNDLSDEEGRGFRMRGSITFIALIMLFGSWTIQEANAMELTKKLLDQLANGEVIVYLKAGRESVKEGTVIGIIDAPPERVFKVITDNENFEQFMPYVKKSNVELGKDGSIINYQYLDFPFPVGDRYYKLRIINSKENIDKGKIFRSSWTYIKGSGNIEDTYGSWMLKEYGQGKTLATYVVCTDPGGRIPKWAQNMATKISLPKIIGRVRQQTKNSEYRD